MVFGIVGDEQHRRRLGESERRIKKPEEVDGPLKETSGLSKEDTKTLARLAAVAAMALGRGVSALVTCIECVGKFMKSTKRIIPLAWSWRPTRFLIIMFIIMTMAATLKLVAALWGQDSNVYWLLDNIASKPGEIMANGADVIWYGIMQIAVFLVWILQLFLTTVNVLWKAFWRGPDFIANALLTSVNVVKAVIDWLAGVMFTILEGRGREALWKWISDNLWSARSVGTGVFEDPVGEIRAQIFANQGINQALTSLVDIWGGKLTDISSYGDFLVSTVLGASQAPFRELTEIDFSDLDFWARLMIAMEATYSLMAHNELPPLQLNALMNDTVGELIEKDQGAVARENLRCLQVYADARIMDKDEPQRLVFGNSGALRKCISETVAHHLRLGLRLPKEPTDFIHQVLFPWGVAVDDELMKQTGRLNVDRAQEIYNAWVLGKPMPPTRDHLLREAKGRVAVSMAVTKYVGSPHVLVSDTAAKAFFWAASLVGRKDQVVETILTTLPPERIHKWKPALQLYGETFVEAVATASTGPRPGIESESIEETGLMPDDD